jgi:hypothetical protein
MNNKTDGTSGTGTVYPSGSREFTRLLIEFVLLEEFEDTRRVIRILNVL